MSYTCCSFQNIKAGVEKAHLLYAENSILWVGRTWGFSGPWEWFTQPKNYLYFKRAVLEKKCGGTRSCRSSGNSSNFCFFHSSLTLTFMGICLYNCAHSGPRLPCKWAQTQTVRPHRALIQIYNNLALLRRTSACLCINYSHISCMHRHRLVRLYLWLISSAGTAAGGWTNLCKVSPAVNSKQALPLCALVVTLRLCSVYPKGLPLFALCTLVNSPTLQVIIYSGSCVATRTYRKKRTNSLLECPDVLRNLLILLKMSKRGTCGNL